MKNRPYNLIALGVTAIMLGMPQTASALTLLHPCIKEQNVPGLYCALDTAVGIGKYLFGIMGSAALVMFVAGGFFIVAAGGREAWVKKGKEYVKNAVIGIAIILLSGYAIQYGVNALRGGVEGTQCSGEYYTADEKGTQACCEAGNVVQVSKEGVFTCNSAPAPAP